MEFNYAQATFILINIIGGITALTYWVIYDDKPSYGISSEIAACIMVTIFWPIWLGVLIGCKLGESKNA